MFDPPTAGTWQRESEELGPLTPPHVYLGAFWSSDTGAWPFVAPTLLPSPSVHCLGLVCKSLSDGFQRVLLPKALSDRQEHREDEEWCRIQGPHSRPACDTSTFLCLIDCRSKTKWDSVNFSRRIAVVSSDLFKAGTWTRGEWVADGKKPAFGPLRFRRPHWRRRLQDPPGSRCTEGISGPGPQLVSRSSLLNGTPDPREGHCGNTGTFQ